MKTVGVIGAGVMGSGISQVLAQSGLEVVIYDISEASLENSRKTIEKNLTKLVEKEKMDVENKEKILKRLHTSNEKQDLKKCQLIIEAATENMEIKKKIIQGLADIINENTILATNTSSLSITEISSVAKYPSNVIGMHFFNPVPVMKLVEVITGIQTDPKVKEIILELSKKAGKTPVLVEEAPGFVVNRILVPMINEAIGVLADGVATAHDIDEAMKLGANHPIGPLALGDLIGLDVTLAIMETLLEEFGDSKYRPHPLLKKMVRAGYLGRKTGRGFFQY
ncbi:3-hydroxybutyryl-CoA dehydrogenase [Alkaliphilus transvaalensis]|uniref:3-hydroxybutyryl-CoA dehydrogenase n=1 Tax=Alkaliphilus transvaalensis TaxID=114628 RepID=UPI00047DFB14|nr:3-hydroxybutyryl-CoA dehydrogenase [Alkaliphilus transvaalensis]